MTKTRKMMAMWVQVTAEIVYDTLRNTHTNNY
jgi:hypothetical protein